MNDFSKCQNPDQHCDREATLLWGGELLLCPRCWQRFYRHNSGRKYEPWDLYWSKKRTEKVG